MAGNLLRNSDLARNGLTAVTTAATGKAAYYMPANIGNAANPAYDSAGMHFVGPTASTANSNANANSGVGVEFAASDLGLVNGDTYALSVEVASLAAASDNNGVAVWQYSSEGSWWTGKATRSKWSSGAGVYHTSFVYDGSAYVYLLMSVGMAGSVTVTRFGLYHAASAAWAPANGEELAGVGALTSANLWDVSAANFKPDADGVYLCSKTAYALYSNITGASALAENQTIHMGASLRGAGKGTLKPYVAYTDAAGNWNYVGFPDWTPSAEWQRFEGSCVVPSGMTPMRFGFNATGDIEVIQVLNPVFSYGSPVCLASSAHTPYATQDHVSVTYATKASLKVTDDSIKAEVSARAQTDRNVADLSSRLTQTANSLTSEISDRRSAIATVTGLANAAQSTADAAKSSASNAVSTANSASTSAANAVKTANAASSAASSASTAAGKASTDAASAVKTANSASSNASSAVTTANSAKSTANAASDTATAAQTMAVENQSSIKQLSTSITAEVTARTETDRTVSDLSSRLTQTASGLSASISKLSETDEKVNAWFDFEADASGNPQLKMGSSTSPVVGTYTNSGLAYRSRDGATIMELDASRSATISDHMEAQDVKLGKWKWVQTQGGTHLTLVWAG